jgi:4-hydroxy-tetrahydrodipicolinate reductase
VVVDAVHVMDRRALVPYRIIQWGTGSVGTHALRMIVERPDFTLAGLRVYNPEKVGADAGVLLDVDPIGVVATDDVEAIVALDADCVSYTPLGGTLAGGHSAIDDICLLLASGKNVISSAVEDLAYLAPGIQLPAAGPDAYARLNAACRDGHASFFHVGVNPGFAMDIWPMQLSRLCRRIDLLRVSEIVDMSTYASIHMVRDAIGFGLAPDASAPLDEHFSDVYRSPFYLSMRMLADALRVELDEVRYHREVAVTDRNLSIAAGTIEAGTVAAMKLHLDGILYGRAAIAFEWVWRVSNEVAPDWPVGDSRWVLHIEGDPTVDSEIALATNFDAGRATSLAVATLVLNAVPTVCQAQPGLINNLNLPPHGGGYFVPTGDSTTSFDGGTAVD